MSLILCVVLDDIDELNQRYLSFIFSYVYLLKYLQLKNCCNEGISTVPELARNRLLVFNAITPCLSLAPFVSLSYTPDFKILLRSRHDHRRLEIGPAAGENRSFFPTRDRGSSWIERTYLTLPGWNGGKKGRKRHKRFDYIHVVYTHKAPQAL